MKLLASSIIKNAANIQIQEQSIKLYNPNPTDELI